MGTFWEQKCHFWEQVKKYFFSFSRGINTAEVYGWGVVGDVGSRARFGLGLAGLGWV